MMLRKLLDRYIFTELLSPFSLSLGTLCFIMLTRELLRLVELLVSKGVGLWAVLKVFAHLLPSFLVLADDLAGSMGSALEFDQSQEGGSQSPPRPARAGSGTGILRGTDPENDDLRLGEG